MPPDPADPLFIKLGAGSRKALVKSKGQKELFIIDVTGSTSPVYDVEVTLEFADGLLGLYGPIATQIWDPLNSTDTFTGAKPSQSDILIAGDEGCCGKMGGHISTQLTSGHYFLQLFHCSTTQVVAEGRQYLLTVSIKNASVPSLHPGHPAAIPTTGRRVNQLFEVIGDGTEGFYEFRTQSVPVGLATSPLLSAYVVPTDNRPSELLTKPHVGQIFAEKKAFGRTFLRVSAAQLSSEGAVFVYATDVSSGAPSVPAPIRPMAAASKPASAPRRVDASDLPTIHHLLVKIGEASDMKVSHPPASGTGGQT